MIGVILFITLGLNVLMQEPSQALATVGVVEGLKQLCSNKVIELRRISQVMAIIDHLQSSKLNAVNLDEFDCTDLVRNSIIDLRPVIGENVDDVCTNEKVEQIRQYYLKYIQIDNNNNNGAQGHTIPSSLRNFFLAFAFKVSGLCKKNMINSLLYEAQGSLDERDFEAIKAWTGEDSFLTSIFKGPNDYDDLVLASELSQLFSDQDSDGASRESKLFVQTATSNVIHQLQETCAKRFRPIYQRLILPLVSLSNMGFNYQGEDLKIELQEISSNKEIHRWYQIVYICDALSRIVLVEDPNERFKVEDKSVVRILSEEEAKKMVESKNLATNNGLEPIVYQPEGLPIGDEIISEDDDSITKLVDQYRARKSEIDRIRSKVIRKVANLVKESILSGKIEMIGSIFKGDDSQSGDMKENVIKSIDEYVQQSTASPLDAPVAGSNYVRRMYHNAVYLGPRGVVGKVSDTTKQHLSPRRAFWYTMAALLFIGGIIFVACIG